MWEEKDINIDSTNIFDEFGVDDKLKKEVEWIEKEKEKDVVYYIWVTSNFFTFMNMIMLLLFVMWGTYFYVQNDDYMKDSVYLTPVCKIFVDDKWEYDDCSSVSSLIVDYDKKNKELINKYYKRNIPLIESIYKNLRFVDSREVSFLLNKTKNKLKVLDILSKFDKIKNDFSPLNKTRIKCEEININSNNEFTIKCSAFSWVWDWEILWYSWSNKWKNKVEWTSISVASSFINFIEKINNSNFIILEKPRKFSFVEIVDNNGYTRKTEFKLKLKYINNISSQK